jgi:cbb3-type cytochrome oxidase subunit 1
MTMFGAAYYILPRLFNLKLTSDRSMRAHFWLSATGVILMAGPLLAAGILEGVKAHDSSHSVLEIARGSLMFFRISSIGELLMLAGNVLFFINLSRLVGEFHRARVIAAYTMATEVVEPSGVRA